MGAWVAAFAAGAAAAHAWPRAEPSEAAEPRGGPVFARTFAVSSFVRGNLHTHTRRSDGDSSPLEVARWYRDHGYGFLALTDHNVVSDLAETAPIASPDFVLIPGEEVSMWVRGMQVHANALCIQRTVAGGQFATVAEAFEHAAGETLAQGGVLLLNHPNFDWAVTPSDVIAADGAKLLEIASGHPYVHSAGDERHPSHEALWDVAVTAGRDVMGVGGDDMHHLVTDADPEAFPGIAWVEAFVERPDAGAICEALRRGDVYASTGARIRSLMVTPQTYRVEPASEDATVVFIGEGGKVLSKRTGAAAYELTGDEGYVRARVEERAGSAWTPAVRVMRGRPGRS